MKTLILRNRRQGRSVRMLLLLLAVLMTFAGSQPAQAKVKKLKLSAASVTITRGRKKTVKVKGKYKKIRVKASKKGYLRISVKGKKIKLQALKAGKVTLTVKGYNKKGRLTGKAKLKVRIKKPKTKTKKKTAKKTSKKTSTAAASKSAGNKAAAADDEEASYVYSAEAAGIFLKAVKAVADLARKSGWTYGDSHTETPCADGLISCDRLIARALYNLGYTEQPLGGITINNGIAAYLAGWGFVKTTDRSKIQPGAVIAVKDRSTGKISHVFVISTYDVKNGLCTKYDTGSNSRIQTVQPFKNVALNEWSSREFLYAYNVPTAMIGTAACKVLEANASQLNAHPDVTYDGVDYSAVYNYAFYKTFYPDLQKAFGNSKEAYFKHFVTYGMKEGRRACAGFNVQNYRNRYADIRTLYKTDYPSYYKHYCLTGKAEGRKGY